MNLKMCGEEEQNAWVKAMGTKKDAVKYGKKHYIKLMFIT